MNVLNHWEQQKQALRPALEEQPDMGGVVYQVRHALLQTEQNALAEITDDALRQQAGVLMSGLKTSVGLLEANITTKVWVRQKAAGHSKRRGAYTLWIIAALVQTLVGVYCYFKGFALAWIGALAVLLLSVAALVSMRPKPAQQDDEMRITLRPDIERLLGLLDGQVRAVDRALNDFSYLNDQLRGGSEGADPATLARAADLMEALYESDSVADAPAFEAARRILESMGLCALEYSEENRRLFNALPSKSETRTLSPAILTREDGKLLRRGTAAVRIDAA